MWIPEKSKKNNLSYTLLRIVWKLFEIDNQIRNYGTDKPLFEAEIHMIKAVKEHEGIHITGLADLLGVTKGAVSQVIMKLQKKGMIIKTKDEKNQSKLSISLTEKGNIAFLNHEELHGKFDRLVQDILDKVSNEHTVLLREFFTSLESRIDDFMSKE